MGEITDSTNASIGFSLFGLVWGLGMILGPILGGFLSYPATKFPQVFGNCLFLKTYPYFLPCAVSACISLVGLIVGYIYLDETCPKRINQGKEYIKVTDSPYSPEILDTVEETDEPDYTSLQINEQIISDSITTLAPDSRNTERISWASITVIQGYALLSFVNIIFDEVFSLYMVSPLIYGGLETTSTTIGSVLSIIGVVQLTCQLTVFPWLCMRFDVIDVYRAGITPYPIIFLLFPVISGFIAPYNKPLAFTCLIIVLSVRQLCNVLSFTGINMLTNISATRQQLGFVNGVGQTSAAFVRGIGPALGGCLWAVTTGYVFPFNYWFVFYTLSGLSCIGLLHGWFCFPKELRSAECEEQVEFGFE